MMFSDLFVNVFIVISYIFLGASLLRDKQVHSRVAKYLVALYCSLMSITLIIYSIKVNDANVIIDLRQVPIVLAYYFGGVISAILTGFFTILFRMGYYGVNQSSFMSLLNILLFIPGFYGIDRLIKNRKYRYIYYSLFSIIVVAPTFQFLLYHNEIRNVILFSYLMSISIVNVLVFYLLNYVERNNFLYRKYKDESKMDFLTGLNNVREFKSIMASLNQNKSEFNQLSVLMIDIDHFKKINDQYGHLIGDQVLMKLAQVIKKEVREQDVVSRVGGEEFCVLLFNQGVDESMQCAERIRHVVEYHDFSVKDHHSLSITISIGVGIYPDRVDSILNLVKHADEALYLSKSNGRNQVTLK